MRFAETFVIASSLVLVGCAGDPSSTSRAANTPPATSASLSLDFDEACAEYDRVSQLNIKAVQRQTEAARNANFDLGASISENIIELLRALSAKDIRDPELSGLISQYTAQYSEYQRFFIDFAEIANTYGAGSTQANMQINDPEMDILREDVFFLRDQINSVCGLP